MFTAAQEQGNAQASCRESGEESSFFRSRLSLVLCSAFQLPFLSAFTCACSKEGFPVDISASFFRSRLLSAHRSCLRSLAVFRIFRLFRVFFFSPPRICAPELSLPFLPEDSAVLLLLLPRSKCDRRFMFRRHRCSFLFKPCSAFLTSPHRCSLLLQHRRKAPAAIHLLLPTRSTRKALIGDLSITPQLCSICTT